jgi:ABC-type sugar transport system ATPase subunit
MVYVTHDQVEAMTLADRIVLLNEGRIEQHGEPLALYEHPANRFVAGFLGQPKMNFVPAVATADGSQLALRLAEQGPVIATRTSFAGIAPGTKVELGIRPDAISLVEKGLPASVVLVERLGGSSLLHARVAGLESLLTVELPGTYQAAAGTTVQLGIDSARVHVFDDGGRTLG